jgi:uroporphyrinogen decarboxylase
VAIVKRREFVLGIAAAPLLGAAMSPKERLDSALAGNAVDRPPYSLWYHFGLEAKGPEAHARATLSFQERFGTDLVKVMSDFPYPKPAGKWWEAKPVASPFEPQLKALAIVRDGLGKRKHFVETIFNPWNVAEKLSSKEEVVRLMRERPQQLLNVLEAIARSEANHARKAAQTGASGIFLAIANAQHGILTPAEYAKFSEPFDRIVLDSVRGAPLNILHLHGDKLYLEPFLKPWPVTVIQYSVHGTGVPMADVRKRYSGVLMGGIDERSFRTLSQSTLAEQISQARAGAGGKFILAPGCSVPNDTADAEIQRFVGAVTRA